MSGKGGRGKGRNMSRSTRAGLQFPVGRLARKLRKGRYSERLGNGAPVYLAGVLEYLTAEMLELSGNKCRDDKRKRIIPQHLLLAVRNDEELNKLVGNALFPTGGVIPQIHPFLLPKTKKAAGPRPSGNSHGGKGKGLKTAAPMPSPTTPAVTA
jgi:histone H2A